jgi:hypothetical protein
MFRELMLGNGSFSPGSPHPSRHSPSVAAGKETRVLQQVSVAVLHSAHIKTDRVCFRVI